jgi:hypothetical protein
VSSVVRGQRRRGADTLGSPSGPWCRITRGKPTSKGLEIRGILVRRLTSRDERHDLRLSAVQAHNMLEFSGRQVDPAAVEELGELGRRPWIKSAWKTDASERFAGETVTLTAPDLNVRLGGIRQDVEEQRVRHDSQAESARKALEADLRVSAQSGILLPAGVDDAPRDRESGRDRRALRGAQRPRGP